jgi:hypothetical protein
MNRKQAIAEWKMRKTPRGVYRLRFSEAGPVFADAVPDLDAVRNSLLFTLRIGAHPNKQLQSEWNSHGEAAFHFEVLEKLEDDLAPMAWRDLLKEKKKEWLEKLGAIPITP